MIQSSAGLSFPVPDRSFRVETQDGVTVAVQEWGNPAGPEILFIHGYLQSHLSWFNQVAGELAEQFRMVTYDLRGHGESDQPQGTEFYRTPGRWGDELAAVIAGAGLRRPVLVPWSYAGRVIADFLEHHGTSGIAGINMVGSRIRSDRRFSGARHPANQALMISEALAPRLEGTHRFLSDCAVAWDRDMLVKAMGISMVVPAAIRAALQGRDFNAEADFASLAVPLLISHGDADEIVQIAAAYHTQTICPAARFSLYQGVGHSPFMEQPQRFNAELAAFVTQCAA